MTDLSGTIDPLLEAAYAAGRADLAGELARLETRPAPQGVTHAGLHRDALAHFSAGRAAEAERDLKLALRLAPGEERLHDHLGVVLASQQRLLEAEATFRVAQRLAPNDPSPRRNRGQCLMDLRNYPEAAEVYRQLLDANSDDGVARLQLGVALGSMRRFAEAEQVLAPLVEPGQATAAAWDRLGVVRGMAGDTAGAANCFRAQITLEPSANAYSNLAAALGKSRDWVGATEAGHEAVRLAPGSAGAWSNLGNALRDSGRVDEAVGALNTAVRLDPIRAEAAGNLALALATRGTPAEALPWYDRALGLDPGNAEVHFNRAVCVLSLGDYARGWPEYEWRFGTEQMRTHKPLPGTPWRGESLDGKSLLIQCEQGHGDTLQFSRLVARLAERGAAVTLVAAPPVQRLLKSMAGVSRVIGPGEPMPPTDYVTPLMTLPLLTGLRLETIPRDCPCLAAPADAAERWHDALADLPGLKVGIAWQGNPTHVGDRFRSVPLTHFAPLAEVPGVSLLSLQLGHGREQLTHAPFPIRDPFTADPRDFAETAGLLQQLDLIVAIDSAVAHLAGCLARPVWVALPVNADWRWLQARDDSPWYPTARLFRQSHFGDWTGVFARVAAELGRLVSA